MLKKTNTNYGFTLVELLIVIVVIAILAAISVVAYNGIQNRGKTSSNQTLASQVAKKAEAFNTIQSNYPANTGAFNATGTPLESRLDNPGAVKAFVSGSGAGGVQNVDTYDNGNSVVYRYCAAGTPTGSTAGGMVYYWNYSDSVAAQIRFGGGC